MQEMASMINKTQKSQVYYFHCYYNYNITNSINCSIRLTDNSSYLGFQEKNSLEDLQRLFAEMVNEAEEVEIARRRFSIEEPINGSSKRKRVTTL